MEYTTSKLCLLNVCWCVRSLVFRHTFLLLFLSFVVSKVPQTIVVALAYGCAEPCLRWMKNEATSLIMLSEPGNEDIAQLTCLAQMNVLNVKMLGQYCFYFRSVTIMGYCTKNDVITKSMEGPSRWATSTCELSKPRPMETNWKSELVRKI